MLFRSSGVCASGVRAFAKKPPVGFDPTTSRLLSGCSANTTKEALQIISERTTQRKRKGSRSEAKVPIIVQPCFFPIIGMNGSTGRASRFHLPMVSHADNKNNFASCCITNRYIREARGFLTPSGRRLVAGLLMRFACKLRCMSTWTHWGLNPGPPAC